MFAVGRFGLLKESDKRENSKIRDFVTSFRGKLNILSLH